MIENIGRTGRQRRASRPKVKTGCNNCKNRRVKCDETRPQCVKCVRSGRTCDGYPAYNPRNRHVDITIPIAPRPADGRASSSSSASSSGSSPPARILVPRRRVNAVQKARPARPTSIVKYISSPTVYRPPTSLPLNFEEGQYFQIFRTHTASELSGFFDSEFWTRSVLQESHSEASIRHAVVALGALYKTLEKGVESPPGSPDSKTTHHDTTESHYRFAQSQYIQGIQQLQKSITNNESSSPRTKLMTCVLFTCYESFTGNHRGAITHIRGGLTLLHQGQNKRKHTLLPRRDDAVEDDLIQMFTRLAIQAKSYDMAFHFPQPWVIRLTPSPSTSNDPPSPQSPSSPTDSTSSLEASIPEKFESLLEARAILDALCERMLRFTEELSSYHPGPNNILPASIKSHGEGFRRQLAQWNTAFDPLLQNRRYPGVNNTERAGINVLKMTQLMMTILFVMAFSKSEMDFDAFIGIFQQIVSLAQEVVVDEELSIASARCGEACRHQTAQANHQGSAHRHSSAYNDFYSHIKPSFALDLGIIPPLFVVATKCRDRKTRREAIRLLTATHRREGMWDSILCGNVGGWIMQIEEENLDEYNITTKDQIVDGERRVMVKEISFDLQTRQATLRCGTRGVMEGDFDYRARTKELFW